MGFQRAATFKSSAFKCYFCFVALCIIKIIFNKIIFIGGAKEEFYRVFFHMRTQPWQKLATCTAVEGQPGSGVEFLDQKLRQGDLFIRFQGFVPILPI